MVVYNFKKIVTVPSASDFVDIVLTRTQRKTPTVIHPTYAISRIRAFYMRKVKFTQQTFQEKLSQIITDFPRLDDIHPFYADLINILYDRDHYKLALGQINTARALIDNIAKDYVRMLKYGDTLYRCKQLKRAALGRMCTLMKKQKSSLEYLEEVRKHLSRLPSIDPNTRTLLVTGFPNVGKSSFMNKVTRADVDVQPYAFTTKALYVGHLDYKYLRWQVIDTPGILDHPLEERNTIEMQAVTALAHLQASVLFFLDVSEQCGFTMEQQISLFKNISPLFANKPLILVANKIDQVKMEDLSQEHKDLIEGAVEQSKAKLMPMSNHNEDGVTAVKNYACDQLLTQRVASKMSSTKKKLDGVMNRLHVAMPSARDDKVRDVCIPNSVLNKSTVPSTRKLQKDLMKENGGAGVYNMDYKEHYRGMLAKDEYVTDRIPEIYNGKNIADFIDMDILSKLKELENEELVYEENMQPEDDDDDMENMLTEEELEKLGRIKEKKRIIQIRKKSTNTNRSVLPRKVIKRTFEEYQEHLDSHGIDTSKLHNAMKKAKLTEQNQTRGRSKSLARGDDSMDVEKRSKSRGRSKSVPRDETGFANEEQRADARKVMKVMQRKNNTMARAGEGDRKQTTKNIKWMLAGKNGRGKTRSR